MDLSVDASELSLLRGGGVVVSSAAVLLPERLSLHEFQQCFHFGVNLRMAKPRGWIEEVCGQRAARVCCPSRRYLFLVTE